MATSGPTSLPAFFSNSTDFQNWVTGIHNALAAIGLIQTADTGQIAPGSVALPGTANTQAGYEIWRLNDALQGSAPFYFKISYGTGSQTNVPSLWLQVGNGSNGSGALNNANTIVQVAATTGKLAGNTNPLYASGDGSRFSLCVNADPSSVNFPIWLVCERTRDANGNNTADGLVICTHGLATSFQVHTGTTFSSTRASSLPLIPACGTASGSQHAVGSNSALGTMAYFCGGPFFGLSLVDVARADVGAVYSSFTATVLGAVHTYMTLLGGAAPNYAGNVDQAADYTCLLWE